MAKILYMSDSPGSLDTGYGKVGKELCSSFMKHGHRVKIIGWGHNRGKKTNNKFDIIPCDFQRENYGEDLLARTIREFKPDILFTLGDPWMTEYIPQLEERSSVYWISYFPIDGYPIPSEWEPWIKNADEAVTFSKFSKNQIDELRKDAKLIYHGVNSQLFKPMDKQECKKEILGSHNKDKFIVGSVGKNQLRKNLPALVKAFARFSKNKDDVALYLHTQQKGQVFDVQSLFKRFKLTGKMYVPNNITFEKGVSDEDMVKIYNMMDVFVLPTMAEGFGLPLLEAQSCGVPIMATNFSSIPDLVVDDAELLKVKDTLIVGRNMEQAIVDEDDIVQGLETFYGDWKSGSKWSQELGNKGRKKAESMDWRSINKEFNKLISQVESKATKIQKRIYPKFYVI